MYKEQSKPGRGRQRGKGRGRESMERESADELFETQRARGRLAFRLYACSVFVGICLIWVYRISEIANGGGWWSKGRWILLGMFGAELWFGLYWVLTISCRWNPVYRRTFKERLIQRYGDKLPGVDVFVCTADPTIEPPIMVINTVLSVMAYDYPTEKLSVYLSDDGGSELTFYALLEASKFASSWIPFCKKFKIEPRVPAAYFKEEKQTSGSTTNEWISIKQLYNEMENRIVAATKLGRVPDILRQQHKGFSEWNEPMTSRDHHGIVQILIDGRIQKTAENRDYALSTLVYMAREKRPHRHHNFKAGAMNSLIRVSSEISNGEIILNVDCDMYSNNAETVKDVLCFFMDKEQGDEYAYVQIPQSFDNVTKNDIYNNSWTMYSEVDFPGCDGYGGPLYVGSGCFSRRKILCGLEYNEAHGSLKHDGRKNAEESPNSLELKAKNLISCTFEDNTEWGKEIGLKYGCPVEDVITGLSIQCRGWKSAYFNPPRKAFLGVAPMTLSDTLIQQKRWSEGDFQIFVSKYCPFVYGHGKIKLGLQMGYSIYCLWAPNSFPILYYVSIPSLGLLNSIALFPNVSSLWFIPFAYVIAATTIYSIAESLWAGLTAKGWWNEQRMWLFRRLACYPFACIDTLLKCFGLSNISFVVTSKVSDDAVLKRYEQEIMEFGTPTPMFTIIATLAMLNLLCLLCGLWRVLLKEGIMVLGSMLVQFLICGSMVIINIPVFAAMFLRSDGGRMPTSVTVTSIALSLLGSVLPLY